MGLMDRLTAPGPKRILALDGGGIRGALTLGYLERVEKVLRDRHNNPDLRLSDYFDMIGGTSTGAIIAAGLATGLTAHEIRAMYLDLGGKIFGERRMGALDYIRALLRQRGRAIFDYRALEVGLKGQFGEERLGSDQLVTGLVIVAKRADTRSTWVLMNHPNGRFYPRNKDIPLRLAVRASTAAPLYFVPQPLDIGGGQEGAFVDGGVSMANNPALQLFFCATLKGYPFRWQTGADRLFLLSVGTGMPGPTTVAAERVLNQRVSYWAVAVPSMLMDDASWQNQLMLQYLSRSPTNWQIDREIGDLEDDVLGSEPALSYVRYNMVLEPQAIEDIGLSKLAPRAKALMAMDAAVNRFELAEVGDAAAARQVREDHFPAAFDLR